jgi:hypothetical protein
VRTGYNAQLVFENGKLLAVATGSDACTEHECGSKPLQAALCTQVETDQAIISALRQGKTVRYPDLAESKRIIKAPANLRATEIHLGAEPEFIFGLSEIPLENHKEDLNFFRGSSRSTIDPNVAGAWDEGSFALRVRGREYVEAAKEFYSELRRGNVAFGGLFFQRPGRVLAGVILVNLRHLTAEDKISIGMAQQKYESSLRLKARDESRAIGQEMTKLMGTTSHFGFLWPLWKDPEESEVVYGLNPGYGVKANYYGPYTREKLIDWAKAKGSYQLC